jgi:hypothetical protein
VIERRCGVRTLVVCTASSLNLRQSSFKRDAPILYLDVPAEFVQYLECLPSLEVRIKGTPLFATEGLKVPRRL